MISQFNCWLWFDVLSWSFRYEFFVFCFCFHFLIQFCRGALIIWWCFVFSGRETDNVFFTDLSDRMLLSEVVWVGDFVLFCSLRSFRRQAAWPLHAVVLSGSGFGADRLPRCSAVLGARDPEGPPPACLTPAVLAAGGNANSSQTTPPSL